MSEETKSWAYTCDKAVMLASKLTQEQALIFIERHLIRYPDHVIYLQDLEEKVELKVGLIVYYQPWSDAIKERVRILWMSPPTDDRIELEDRIALVDMFSEPMRNERRYRLLPVRKLSIITPEPEVYVVTTRVSALSPEAAIQFVKASPLIYMFEAHRLERT